MAVSAYESEDVGENPAPDGRVVLVPLRLVVGDLPVPPKERDERLHVGVVILEEHPVEFELDGAGFEMDSVRPVYFKANVCGGEFGILYPPSGSSGGCWSVSTRSFWPP